MEKVIAQCVIGVDDTTQNRAVNDLDVEDATCVLASAVPNEVVKGTILLSMVVNIT